MKRQLPSEFSLNNLTNTAGIALVLFMCLMLQTQDKLKASGCNPAPTYCITQGATNLYGNGYVTEFKISDPASLTLIDEVATAAISCCNYIDNTGVGTPNLTQGVTYTISGSRKDIDWLNAWNYGMNIWIDYNDDGIFNNTNGNIEVVFKQGITNVEPFSFTYTIPTSGITTGIHRLRIRTHYNDGNPDPCANLTNGAQGMDFLVNIVCAHTPPSAFTGSDIAVCTGANANLTSGATAGNAPLSYSWCGPNSFASSQQNPVITGVVPADSGKYTVVVTDSNGCVSSAFMNVSIGGSLTASASSNGPLCAGSTLTLSSGGGTGYSWTGPNGFTSSQQNPVINTISPADSGIYIVTVTAGGGCSGTATTAVSINSSPVASASTSIDTICYGTELDLHSAGGVSYSWTGPAGFSSTDQNPIINTAISLMAGTYTVTVTGAGGCTSTATVAVAVYPAMTPPAISQSGDSLLCTDLTYSHYQWYADTTLITGATHPLLIVTKGGNYNIQVTNNNGCEIAVGINVTFTGIPTLFASGANDNFSLAPNPATSQITVLFSVKQNAKVSIVNMLGQETSAVLLEKNETGSTFDVRNLSPGIYFLQLQSPGIFITKKFVKE